MLDPQPSADPVDPARDTRGESLVARSLGLVGFPEILERAGDFSAPS